MSTREYRAGAVTGAIFTAIAAIAIMQLDEGFDKAAAEAMTKEQTGVQLQLRDAIALLEGERDAARELLTLTHAENAKLRTRADAGVARLATSTAAIAIDSGPAVRRVPMVGNYPLRLDTTRMVTLFRRGVDDPEHPFFVPKFFVDSYTEAVQTVRVLDSLAQGDRAELQLAAQIITAQEKRDTFRLAQIGSVEIERDWWKRAKTPRCGRRCGIAIGVVATTGAAMVVERVRRAAR